FCGMEHKPFVGMCTNWLSMVFHGEMHIARSDKCLGRMLLQSFDHQVMHGIGVASTGSKVCNCNVELIVFVHLFMNNIHDFSIIHPFLSSYFIIGFTDQCHQGHLP